MLLDLGRPAEGEPELERALARHREIGNRDGEASALLGLASFAAVLGRREEARAHAEASLAISREVGDRVTEASAVYALAEAAEEDGDVSAAQRLRDETVEMLRSLGRVERLAGVLLARAEARLRAGRLDEARDDLDAAEGPARVTGEPWPLAYLAALRARLPGGDATTARAACAAQDHRLGVPSRMASHFRLFGLDGNSTDLEEARRLLHVLRAGAAERDRKTILENVRLHREIEAAWAKHSPRTAEVARPA
jgi:tetratricopeptide (TPR) repeat protein